MAKRKDSSKKKRKGSGNGLLIAAVLLTILFLAGVMSLGALYYLEKNKEKPQTIPPKITEACYLCASSCFKKDNRGCCCCDTDRRTDKGV